MPNPAPPLPIRVASPVIGDSEIAAVTRVLRTGLLAQGREVSELERRFAAVAGTASAVAVSSGTAALHTAIAALGIGPGDEVITTPFTFIATANAIKMCGAIVRFADIDPATFNLDPASVENRIGPNTKAIVAVGLYGQPYDADAIAAVARRSSLRVVEDAAQSVGATFNGRPSGSLGDVACFSLYATKNIMCGEGGVITTDDSEIDQRARLFRQHGMRGRYDYEGL
ncbi:MAG TPA: DegT/DnrJ/EryC1/StrS family aminotransferase, partial [Rhodothermales bacterium]